MRVLLIVLLCLASPLALAALPSMEFIKQNLAGLGERKLPESEQQQTQQALEQTLVWLDTLERNRQALAELEQQLQQAPQQIRRNKQQLTSLQQQQDARKVPQNLTILQLEQLVNEQTGQLEQWQKELNEAKALIIRTQTRPERAQIQISNNQRRIQEISTLLKNSKEGGKVLMLAEVQNNLESEQAALKERNRLNQAELSANSILQDLAASNRELLTTRVESQEQYLQSLQQELNARRQAASELAVHEQSLGVERAGEDALLLKESNLNDSNLDQARKLMLQTMQENSRIMNDPEPVVLFLGVGPSSFNHELRYYVREISDRNPSIDEVLNQLVARFREHQIEMAFQQLDVYIKNEQGEQAHWSTRQRA